MKKLIIALVLSALLISGAAAYFLYVQVFGGNIKPLKEDSILLIPTGASFETVMDTLTNNLEIRNIKSFIWVAERKRYTQNIKPGRYRVSDEMSNAALVNMLRSGDQAPVRLTFSNIRTLPQLAARIGRVIEADSIQIIDFLSDESNYAGEGFKRETIISVFIPDTYELFWNTDSRGLYERMLREYRKFWNDERLQKASAAGLEPQEVSILASIIDDEVSKKDEKPRIAGVY
ncbi:MAG: endolytic transglycosylase MltG, partial [Bacteroidales bacterium]|nr:endolytic transglycosylase MltG [Bacteroidales bacterium]